MDIDLPEDYIFWGLGEDSDRESHHSYAPISIRVAAATEEVHSSSEEVVCTDFDPSEDGSGGEDEVMSGLEVESSFEDEDEEMSPTEEEDEEEDPMEDASWRVDAHMVKSRTFCLEVSFWVMMLLPLLWLVVVDFLYRKFFLYVCIHFRCISL